MTGIHIAMTAHSNDRYTHSNVSTHTAVTGIHIAMSEHTAVMGIHIAMTAHSNDRYTHVDYILPFYHVD